MTEKGSRHVASEVIESIKKIALTGGPKLPRAHVDLLIKKSRKLFLAEKTLLEFDAPVKICGDTHGQLKDLLRMFEKAGWPPKEKYLFLGDYVDRGPNSIEVICLLLAFKVQNPKHMLLLRGNHESILINSVYGFKDDVMREYDNDLFMAFNGCFDCMPIAALVSNEIFCMHGGISPELKHFDQIRQLKRPMPVPVSGLVCDLLWADPGDDSGVAGFQQSTRGVSYLFGSDAVVDCLGQLQIGLIVRAHQVAMNGFELRCKGKVITVFSAPFYCDQFQNAAAVLIVNKDLVVEARVFTRQGQQLKKDKDIQKPMT